MQHGPRNERDGLRSGGAIGAGLFVGSGGAFQTGGPASVFLGFLIVGKLKLFNFTMRQLTY